MKEFLKPKIHLVGIAAALLLLSLLVAGCSFTEGSASKEAEINIEGAEFEYTPSTLEVVAGQEVTLTFKNVGDLEHDLNIDHLPIEEGRVLAGGSSHAHDEASDDEHGSEHNGEHEHQESSTHEHEGDAENKEGSEHTHEEGAEHEVENAAEPTLHAHTESGGELTVTFTPTEPGTYEFYCSVPGHREEGMVGTLVVNAP